jgi:hypothetical protein
MRFKHYYCTLLPYLSFLTFQKLDLNINWLIWQIPALDLEYINVGEFNIINNSFYRMFNVRSIRGSHFLFGLLRHSSHSSSITHHVAMSAPLAAFGRFQSFQAFCENLWIWIICLYLIVSRCVIEFFIVVSLKLENTLGADSICCYYRGH